MADLRELVAERANEACPLEITHREAQHIADAVLQALTEAGVLPEPLPRMVDIPLAWEVTRATPRDQHHERCSYRTDAMLCDCALMRGLEYLSVKFRASAIADALKGGTDA